MADRDPHELDLEFSRYREHVVPLVRGTGPDAARRTVRRRRRTTLTASAALALVVMAGPIAGYAASHRDAGREPVPAGSVGPTIGPAPGPTTPTTPAPAVTSAPAPPDGRISRAQLLAARVDLPAWRPGPGCPSEQARLVGEPLRDGDNVLVVVDHTDLDADGAVETVALVRCLVGQGGPAQVVAFDRDRDGRITTMGRVLQTARSGPQWLTDLDARPDGSVRVEMADIAPGGGWPLALSQLQWRTYRWDGADFAQTAGPASFGPNPNLVDVGVTATDLRWEPAGPDGFRHGTVTVTVRNHSAQRVAGAQLTVGMQPGLTAHGTGWSACVGDAPVDDLTCRLGPLAPGATRTLVLGIRDGASSQGAGVASVEPVDRDGRTLMDPARENNEDRFTYR